MSKAPTLTIEKFQDGEESKYLIRSQKEIQLTLHAIAQKKPAAVVYFDNGQRFFNTILLEANAQGVWLDVGPDNTDNNLVMNSDDITFVTMHQGAKVQFACHQFQVAIYASHPSFHCVLPQTMVRLQRRDYFRLPTTGDAPLKCVIPHAQENATRLETATIMDISLGGIALVCKELNVRLDAGATYPDCKIDLPEIGTLIVSIKVKNLFDVSSPSGAVTKHAGCEFVELDGKMSMLLQRYVAIMQSRMSGSR